MSDKMTILVLGGIEPVRQSYLNGALDLMHGMKPIAELLCVRDATVMAWTNNWALNRKVPVRDFPVAKGDWTRYGKASQVIRDKRVIEEGQPDIALAFMLNPETHAMAQRCLASKIPVLCFYGEESTIPPKLLHNQ